MTDSTAPRGGKRERLVTSAGERLHRKGVAATTLADIAQAADVPVGNVYYYFKTKDDLVRAVLEAQVDQVEAMLASFETLPQPVDRLKALVRRWDEMRDVIARYGCPFGTLASELDRRDDGLDLEAAGPIRRILEWAEIQIRQLGQPDARELAITLFAGVQGGALLAGALRDPNLMSGQVRHLERWIDTVAASSTQS
ncbi:TetR family transcriptional regulator [Amycolatopsis mediterranei S699]|uniref:TetR family transcriptional regulator n=2 Tax=Amycolatopsis mediterranei TaxID=33910 RepID=A0A0H3DCU1_AMYMU|nr:TetR/AcrR family transcriptional regulator [Amycolatopsis mediterranei]ADJ47459.1 TetR family transcriptional regulator [Amycolatopsis mediterranei U32]AEK44308.1 TetR family transcriptional regulator [Amycolatopsis mediterranei S699]AFO79170.1 TetR family transcriptional regulator [Amycolatopsis mediterranei S699]AGT86298.1 TetR family transcriptional regulator [Amycolatopsis mediterranei RB]KDO12616.1 TetR family transcriptional regulator [Amycolatopsis mediterranei]